MYLYMVYIYIYSVGNLDTYLFTDSKKKKKIGVGIDLVASFVVCTLYCRKCYCNVHRQSLLLML